MDRAVSETEGQPCSFGTCSSMREPREGNSLHCRASSVLLPFLIFNSISLYSSMEPFIVEQWYADCYEQGHIERGLPTPLCAHARKNDVDGQSQRDCVFVVPTSRTARTPGVAWCHMVCARYPWNLYHLISCHITRCDVMWHNRLTDFNILISIPITILDSCPQTCPFLHQIISRIA